MDDCKLIPLESLGTHQTYDPEPKKLPAFEAAIPEAFAENYRHRKLKQREEKPRKQKRVGEGPLEKCELSDSHLVRDPRNDLVFDPSNSFVGLKSILGIQTKFRNKPPALTGFVSQF